MIKHLAVIIVVTLMASSSYAKKTNNGHAFFRNKTGSTVVFAAFSHKYSNEFMNFGKITFVQPNNDYSRFRDKDGGDNKTVTWNTGFGTTGADWWQLWFVKENGELCVTSPNNFRGIFDGADKIWDKMAHKAIATFDAIKGGQLSGVLKQNGGKLTNEYIQKVEYIQDSIFRIIGSSSTSTVGYKKHTLDSGDTGVVFEVWKDKVKIIDKGKGNDVSETNLKCQKAP